MRSLFLVFMIWTLIQPANAQFKQDAVSKKEIYIQKTDSLLNWKIRISNQNLKNVKQAEQLFGSNYSVRKYFSELFDGNFTAITYSEGLNLVFSDDSKSLFTFGIKSDKYTLVLGNGRQIRTGMN